jgi:Anti-sigma factor NepR
MGELGNNDAMKSHRTNLDTVEPDSAKPGPQGSSMAKRPHKPEIRLGREAQARIGELLRSMYNSYVGQGVPQHLDDLVRRLGEQD